MEYINLDTLGADVQFYAVKLRLRMNLYALLMGEETHTFGNEIMKEDCEGNKDGVNLSCRNCVLREHRVKRGRG